ncbi:MAG TPA: outer membrane protein transport protein, partial [bacterium]|nr:outer membrane protein transport protein [bacterium]
SVQMGTEFVRYSCLKSMKVDAGPNSFLIPEMERDWKDVWTYSASLRYRINNKCDITAGIGFIESPVPDKTFDPLLPDADRFLYTIGTTIKIKSGLFSFFYMYNQFEKRNIQQGRFTDGIYKSSGSFVGCGYTAGI